MSEPQKPQARTRTTTSSSSADGSGTSSSWICSGSWKTAAFIALPRCDGRGLADVPVEEVAQEGEAVPRVLPCLRAHRDRVDGPPLAVVRLREHRHQLLEVDDPLAEVALRPEHVQVRVHVRVAEMDVADAAFGKHVDELDLIRQRLRRLDVVVPDHPARLEVPGVVHQLEVVVADVLEELDRLRRLVDRLE